MQLATVLGLCLVVALCSSAKLRIPKRCRGMACSEDEHCKIIQETPPCFVAPCPTNTVAKCVPNEKDDTEPSCAPDSCPADKKCVVKQIACFVAPCDPPTIECE
uniref:Uncharacterized protein n=1 Tax=Plectus sambesii TaxID=2011161 RepID=A0A914WCF8_9BILA